MGIALRCLAATYYGGFHIKPHRHHWGQLIYAGAGAMRVRAGDTLWIVPPARAVWVPAGAEHEIHGLGDFAMRTLYFVDELNAGLPDQCCAIDVPPLLRELVLELVKRCPVDSDDTECMRLAAVTRDEIRAARTLPLQLPLPADARAVRVADRLRGDPACELEIGQLARDAGASARTLQRLFLTETGLRFGEWRQRLRLMHGAGRLGMGASVTEAAFDSGYASASAFTAAYRKHFGTIPSEARMR